MKIKNVTVNNRKKCLEVNTAKGKLVLPFSKLRLVPTLDNRIAKAYVDRDLGGEAITYELTSGDEDSVHVDAFLEYCRDPGYMRKLLLHNLTVKAIGAVKNSKISRRAIARRLGTSPTQVYRILDPANYSKTVDQVMRLLWAVDCSVDVKIYRDTQADLGDNT